MVGCWETAADYCCGHVNEFPGFRGLRVGSTDVGKGGIWISRMRHCDGVRLDITSNPEPNPRRQRVRKQPTGKVG
jgi:hypothetical protein